MLFVLAAVCPPLAVLASTGSARRTAANTGLTLLLYAPGLVHAVSAARQHYTDRRNAALLRAFSLQYA